mmetsp:Transcript_43992/g.128080  ORF Transcript_43992/g.128080 Transcript_43992/m.128080 type:complete len:245 (+) Transcript_43992:699-1433(+)
MRGEPGLVPLFVSVASPVSSSESGDVSTAASGDESAPAPAATGGSSCASSASGASPSKPAASGSTGRPSWPLTPTACGVSWPECRMLREMRSAGGARHRPGPARRGLCASLERESEGLCRGARRDGVDREAVHAAALPAIGDSAACASASPEPPSPKAPPSGTRPGARFVGDDRVIGNAGGPLAIPAACVPPSRALSLWNGARPEARVEGEGLPGALLHAPTASVMRAPPWPATSLREGPRRGI